MSSQFSPFQPLQDNMNMDKNNLVLPLVMKYKADEIAV
jgi:hypothetical protein